MMNNIEGENQTELLDELRKLSTFSIFFSRVRQILI